MSALPATAGFGMKGLVRGAFLRNTQSMGSFLFSPWHLCVAFSWTRLVPLHIHRTPPPLLPCTSVTVGCLSYIHQLRGSFQDQGCINNTFSALYSQHPEMNLSSLALALGSRVEVQWKGHSPGARSQFSLTQP